MDDTLQKIRYKKVRQKLRYLQTELEETKMIYQVCLDKFNIIMILNSKVLLEH